PRSSPRALAPGAGLELARAPRGPGPRPSRHDGARSVGYALYGSSRPLVAAGARPATVPERGSAPARPRRAWRPSVLGPTGSLTVRVNVPKKTLADVLSNVERMIPARSSNPGLKIGRASCREGVSRWKGLGNV